MTNIPDTIDPTIEALLKGIAKALNIKAGWYRKHDAYNTRPIDTNNYLSVTFNHLDIQEIKIEYRCNNKSIDVAMDHLIVTLADPKMFQIIEEWGNMLRKGEEGYDIFNSSKSNTSE